MVLCALFLRTTLPTLNVLQVLGFELHVTFLPVFEQSEVQSGRATRLKRQPFSESMRQGHHTGKSSMWVGIYESAQV